MEATLGDPVVSVVGVIIAEGVEAAKALEMACSAGTYVILYWVAMA